MCCANVANLLLARAGVRTREVALRSALGAGRPRIIRQLLTESVVLAAISAIPGVVIGAFILRLAPVFIPAGLLPPAASLEFDGRVLAFCAASAIAVGILFGMFPAWQASRASLLDALALDSLYDDIVWTTTRRDRRGADRGGSRAAVRRRIAFADPARTRRNACRLQSRRRQCVDARLLGSSRPLSAGAHAGVLRCGRAGRERASGRHLQRLVQHAAVGQHRNRPMAVRGRRRAGAGARRQAARRIHHCRRRLLPHRRHSDRRRTPVQRSGHGAHDTGLHCQRGVRPAISPRPGSDWSAGEHSSNFPYCAARGLGGRRRRPAGERRAGRAGSAAAGLRAPGPGALR